MSIKRAKNITFAAGIFYPEVGGPSIHTRKIADRLSETGWKCKVITYSQKREKDDFTYVVKRVSKKIPKFFRWLSYFLKVLFSSLKSKIIFAFDPSAAGIPAFLVSKITGKRFVIRIGGDPIWERVVENNKRFISIQDYYKNNFHLKDRPILFKIIKFILNRSDKIIVYGDILKDIYVDNYGIDKNKFETIKNPLLDKKNITKKEDEEVTFLFAGRFVSYKNLPLVIEAFNSVRVKRGFGKLILVGDGPEKENISKLIKNLGAESYIKVKDKMGQNDLFNIIQNSSVCIAPALTEFNPNFILESISFGKPILITKDNNLTIQMKSDFLIDTTNKADLENKINRFYDKDFFEKSKKYIRELDLSYGWDDVLNKYVNLIEKI